MDKPHYTITRIFADLFQSEKTGGFILIACTLVSMGIANTHLGPSYIHFWHQPVDLSFANLGLHYRLEEWINDGLMAIFFLMVGLEIERELYVGELAEFRNALLPLMAAVGGMGLPALIHFLCNHHSPTQPGVGIPMATDIAFSLGMLSLLGNRVPASLKIFLTALAIIDDLGAVIVIAVFYTKGFSGFYLLVALGIFCLLILCNRLRIYALWVYLGAGAIMWYFMLKSGVHATISGVLLAFAIPFRREDRLNPSYALQQFLHRPVNLLIIPIFALANTAIPLTGNWISQLHTQNSLGIIAGLVIGKPLGILLFCWITVILKYSALPEGITWKILAGAGVLAGIGFTMSIFITNLAFAGAHSLIEESKIAVLAASLLAALGGLAILFVAGQRIRRS
jgi:NhaA family Na+:H+ antiporter